MTENRRRTDALEVASAIVLSVSGLASSWAGYQAGLWDGDQAASYSQANALRIQASRAALEGDALATVEVQMFTAWLDASSRGDAKLASFYQARFPAGLRAAFNSWMADRPFINPSAPPTPFAAGGYDRPGLRAAQALERQADQTFKQGEYANRVSDAFQQGATLLAISLFFAGIGQVFNLQAARVGLLIVASLATLTGLLRILSLPLQVLGLQPPG